MLFSTGENDLVFEYNTPHKVLICHKCQYAVQKSALSSHLLRHKIYRGERQKLLADFSALDLLEPDHVTLPSPENPPINGLPVITGLRCAATPDCGHLCVSEKRMRRHWAEQHIPHGSDGDDTSSAAASQSRAAKLQTFYRGTRIRYFEVTPNDGPDAQPPAPAPSGQEALRPVRPAPSLPPLVLPSNPVLAAADAGVSDPSTSVSDLINLETLAYFHHFTSKTSPTLPLSDAADSDSRTDGYWATVAVQCSLRDSSLMSGLLAISAFHRAVSESDPSEKAKHLQKHELFAIEFRKRWSLEGRAQATGHEESSTVDVARRIYGILECIQCCAWHESIAENSPQESLCRLLRSVHGITDRRVDLSQLVKGECEHPLWQPADEFHAPREQPASSLDGMQDTEMSDARSAPGPGVTLSRSLPYRLADMYGKPTNAMVFVVHLKAIRALIQVNEGLAHVNKPEELPVAIVSWIDDVGDSFISLVEEEDAPTLFILATFAASVLGEAAKRGCWYLDGVAECIVSLVEHCLPSENPQIRELLADIKSCIDTG